MTRSLSPAWSRLIRFEPVKSDTHPPLALWGEPVDFKQDIGLAMMENSKAEVRVRVWHMDHPWDENAKLTDSIVTVGKLLSPVPFGGSDIRAVGLNYKDHAAEMKLPMPKVPSIFFKSRNTLAHPGQAVSSPKIAQNDELDYEVELAFIIGKLCLNVTEADALDFVVGYTCANDLTARKVQETSTQWTFAKGFDTFCPLGPVLVSPRALPDPSVVRLQTHVNGERMQDGFASSMIFPVQKIIAYMSQGTTLHPGTIIITGTPSGIGNGRVPRIWLKDGDRVSCSISHGIGTLNSDILYQDSGQEGDHF